MEDDDQVLTRESRKLTRKKERAGRIWKIRVH